MSLAVDIYGTLINLPEKPRLIGVENWGTAIPSEQYWQRKELPSIFNKVEFDKDNNALLTPQQEAFAAIEAERCKQGYYFLNNGIVTYISGKHYFYLQWWKLEEGIYPDYRDTDRRYFCFLNHWENILWCLGIIRGKKRREGASSQATSNLIYECIFFTNSNCGLVSKTLQDSRDTFIEMVRNGYNELPVFFKPRQLNRPDSVTELVFAAKLEKGGSEGGQKSKVVYKAPVLNAFDRGRLSRLLLDEMGKFPLDVPASKFLAIVAKTMVQGARRVGFAECPSTVNELTKGGGMQYKIIWDNANQFKNGSRPTTNRFVTYFSCAYDGYEGFIDKHGMSVISEPNEEQFNYLVSKWVKQDPITGDIISELTADDIRKGAKHYVLVTRRSGLTGELLEEEIRMNPCTVQEMFEAANTNCAFNSYNINKRIKELEVAPVYKRDILFYADYDLEGKRTVKYRDITPNEKNFHWSITALPPDGQENKYEMVGKLKMPARIGDGAITVDSYSNSQGGRKYGSKASAWIGRRHDALDPHNTGKPIGHLYGRPAVKDTLHDQVMLAGEFYGYKIWYEHTSDDYEGFFRERGMSGYLGIYPMSLIDPIKRENAERYKGTPITPFSLSKQMDGGISFFEHHSDKVDFLELLENAKIFDPYNRTEYDAVVSFLMLVAVLTESVYVVAPPKAPLIKMYDSKSTGAWKNPALADA